MDVKSKFKILGLALLFFALLPLQASAHNPDVRVTGDGNLFQQYSWLEMINPYLFLTLVLVYIGYLWAMRKVSTKHLGERYLKKKILFLLGLLTIYVSLAGPISILSNNLVFSAHMLQQGLMYITMPFLTLLGMPHEFYQLLDERLLKHRILRIFRLPLVNLLAFNVLWSLYHIPTIYEYIWHQFILLEALHLVINSFAFLMWIQVLTPMGQINEMSYLKRIGYMFANGMLILPACALIIFAGDVIYPSIYESPQVFSWLTPKGDQQLGGIIMKLVQEIFYGIAIGYVFFKWAKFERGKDAQIAEFPKNTVEQSS